MWALDGSGRFSDRKRKYQESHAKVSQVYEEIHIPVSFEWATGWKQPKTVTGIELKSLILAQIERWRHALHMQVERQHGLRPGGEWRTGE